MLRRIVVLTCLTTAATLLTAPGAGAAPARPAGAPAASAAAPLTWSRCLPSDPEHPELEALRCADLQVPLDPRAPSGRTITIAISRLPARRPDLRRGILLANPGGPGGSGRLLPVVLPQVFPADVLDRYDLIGFDPRGVGHSTPVSCGLDVTAASAVTRVLPYPDAEGGIGRNLDFARATALSCAEHSGDLLPFVTTANTARDMDAIRQALGEPRLSYFGVSYGTYLGAVYASLFPSRTDRMILDSNVDPALVWQRMWRTWGAAVAERLPDFARWAAGHRTPVDLGATAAEVTATLTGLEQRLDRAPVTVEDYQVDGNLLREAVRQALYDDTSFAPLAELVGSLRDAAAAAPTASTRAATASSATPRAAVRLSEAARRLLTDRSGPLGGGRLATLARAADDDPGREPGSDVPGGDVPADNSVAALYAVVCDDVAWPRDLDGYRAEVARQRARHPQTAGMPGNVWPCTFWPSRPVEPPVTVGHRGPRNILLLQNRRDPATPWSSGLGLRRALGDRAAFVGVDQGGHGVYGLKSCADAIADSFLVTGQLPDRDRYCGAPSPSGTAPLAAVAGSAR